MSSTPSSGDASGSPSLVERFRKHLSREGLKCTRQRDLIAGVFATIPGHVSVEELAAQVASRDASIGYATVYRTLKLLVEGGLASIHRFGDGQTRFEVRREGHHDHLICLECGTVIEFHSDRLERRQEEVARTFGFHIQRHRHELFGICEAFASGRSCPFRDQALAESGRVNPRPGGTSRHLMDEIPGTRELPASFRAHLEREGLKSTRQRTLIVEVFARMAGHISVDELLAEVRKREDHVSYATVYRTLKLLVEGGFAVERSFGDGHRRYERRSQEHHDHMICERTGRIIEFHDQEIEALQEAIARDLGFRLMRHRHELYGHLKADPPDRHGLGGQVPRGAQEGSG